MSRLHAERDKAVSDVEKVREELERCQSTLGKVQLSQEKTQQGLDKAQNEVDRLQERLDKATVEARKVLLFISPFTIIYAVLNNYLFILNHLMPSRADAIFATLQPLQMILLDEWALQLPLTANPRRNEQQKLHPRIERCLAVEISIERSMPSSGKKKNCVLFLVFCFFIFHANQYNGGTPQLLIKQEKEC